MSTASNSTDKKTPNRYTTKASPTPSTTDQPPKSTTLPPPQPKNNLTDKPPTIPPSPKPNNNSKKPKKPFEKRLLLILFVLIFIGLGFLFYILEIGSFISQQLTSSNPSSITSVNSQTTDPDIELLHTEIERLEKQFKLLQNESNRQQQSLLNSFRKNEQMQQKQLRVFAKQMAQFTTQINRWKAQLSNSKTLLEAIQNQLKLVQAQSLMNYSPFLLAHQLTVIKQMLDDLHIDELLPARLELANLIQKLDLKPSPPIEFWLSELDLANRSISLWVQQQKESLPVNIAPENTVPNSETATPNQQNKSFLAKLGNHISQRLGNSLSISKSANTNNTNVPFIDTPQLNSEELGKQFQNRIEHLRLSLLSHAWDQIHLQSLDLYQWIGENLSNIDTDLKDTLTQMSQYKSKDVPTSLIKIIQSIDDYQNRPNTDVPMAVTNNNATTTPTTIVPVAPQSVTIHASTINKIITTPSLGVPLNAIPIEKQ